MMMNGEIKIFAGRSSIALADRVVLIDGGRVVAEGTHLGLLSGDARYRAVLAAAGDDEGVGSGAVGTGDEARERRTHEVAS